MTRFGWIVRSTSVVLAPLAIILVLPLLLQYGGYSVRQSTTLMWIFLAVYLALRLKTENALEQITPFSVTILPNWYELLKESGLIDHEKWNALYQESQARSSSDYNVLRDGITFTVLPPVAKGFMPKGWAPGLIYSNNHNIFVSRMDLFRGIREQIPVKCSPKSESVDEAVYYVRLMQVRKNEVGLEIGMTIPTSCRNAAGNGRADMVATLPPEVFEYFYRPQDYDFSRSGGARRFQKWHELEKLRLAEFGWMEGHGKGMYYVHKYATVDVREIV